MKVIPAEFLGACCEWTDATCPMVRRVRDAANELQREGYFVIVIGRRGHGEVRGIVKDLTEFDIVGGPDEVRTWPHQRLGIVCQTTMAPHEVEEILTNIQLANQLAELHLVDTVHEPTRSRQQTLQALFAQVDAVVVVGGSESSNTRQLVRFCHRHGVPATHIQRADELDPQWFADCETVGLAAGTSARDETVHEVHEALSTMETPARCVY